MKPYLGLLVFALLASGCSFNQEVDLQKAPDGPTVTINSQAFSVEIADTDELRLKGLSGRETLEEDHGMLFTFESPQRPGFWMNGVNFPLDVIWIHDDTVVDLDDNILPPPPVRTVQSEEDITKALEIPGGSIQKYGIEKGQKVDFTNIP